MTGLRPRRFWSKTEVTEQEDGFGIRLDDRPLMTPAKAELIVPTRALAEAIAAEWNAIDGEIRPDRLPFTRAANAAIDRVAALHAAVVASIADYGAADLLCYRADEPEALTLRQASLWDPQLAWAARELAAPLAAINGIVHVTQPPSSLAALRAAVAGLDPFRLTALHDLVALSGSLVLGLAVVRGALEAEAAWDLSSLDATWQAEQWGIDTEAEAAAALNRADFLRAGALIRLLDDVESG